jgi:hypothetical protein
MIKYEYFLVSYPIGKIREFFNTCHKTVEDDLNRIEEQNENGLYKDYSIYESLLETPFLRSEIIYYATLNELNILCEKIIREIYYNLFVDSKIKQDKSFISDNDGLIQRVEKLSAIKFESFKISIDNCIKFVGKQNNSEIESINGYETFSNIRERINSYKHRDSIKLKKPEKEIINFNILEERYKAYELEIGTTIKTIEQFLLDLYKFTKSKSN